LEDVQPGKMNHNGNKTGKEAVLPKSPAIQRGKDLFRQSVVNGNVTTVLGNISNWAEVVREATEALEQVIELARATLQNQGSGEGIPAQQISLTPNPALFVNLLKAPEFQQVIAALLVQLLKE